MAHSFVLDFFCHLSLSPCFLHLTSYLSFFFYSPCQLLILHLAYNALMPLIIYLSLTVLLFSYSILQKRQFYSQAPASGKCLFVIIVNSNSQQISLFCCLECLCHNYLTVVTLHNVWLNWIFFGAQTD